MIAQPEASLLNTQALRTVAVVSLVGLSACGFVIFRFFRRWTVGDIDWWPGFRGREVYMAAGHGYGEGFVTGFFVAFFLVLLSIVVSTWWDARGRRRRESPDPPTPVVRAGHDA